MGTNCSWKMPQGKGCSHWASSEWYCIEISKWGYQGNCHVHQITVILWRWTFGLIQTCWSLCAASVLVFTTTTIVRSLIFKATLKMGEEDRTMTRKNHKIHCSYQSCHFSWINGPQIVFVNLYNSCKSWFWHFFSLMFFLKKFFLFIF
jgi:hypothetical protein